MTSEEKEFINDKIDEDGFYYTFISYSKFEKIKDEKFHELRTNFLKSVNQLRNYLKSED